MNKLIISLEEIDLSVPDYITSTMMYQLFM